MEQQNDSKLKQFWNRVKVQRVKIEELFASDSLPRDPDAGPAQIAFIESVENYDRGTSAGAISSATFQTAAQRIVEQTHRLATEDQVEMYLLEQTERAKSILKKDSLTKMRRVAGSLLGEATAATLAN